jgi:succinate-semialdehyde dehydrogenase/glutarate-semialdehyde dehydrogenase
VQYDSLIDAPRDLYVGGRWLPGSSGERFDVNDPATDSLLLQVANAGPADADAAVESAASALDAWAGSTAEQRASILAASVSVLRERADALTELITAETGKPLREASGEVVISIRLLEWFAEESRRLTPEYWPSISPGRDCVVVNEAIGVVTAITPWNYPLYLVVCKVGAALAAGCTVLLKPAEQTPLTALAFASALDAAGIPAGVLNVVTTDDPRRIGDSLLHHPAVACISFTGSRVVGAELLRAAAPAIKRVLLELGGSAPLVVLDDADLDNAVAGAVRARFGNAGQACVAANRIYVTPGIADAFVERFVEAVRGLKVGSPQDPTTDIGPLIDAAAAERLQAQVEAAVAEGALVAVGGGPPERDGGLYFTPTVLLSSDKVPSICRDEVFGPVAIITRCDSADDAITAANDSEYGLAAYIFAGDSRRAYDIARRLRAGAVAVNGPLTAEPQLPFGGVGASGLGRERGRRGIEEFQETKTIHLVG